MSLKINTVIFDFDGVIINSGKDIANAVNYTLEFLGKEKLSDKEIISNIGNGMKHLIEKCLKEFDEELLINSINIYKDYYMRHCAVETTLYKNVRETLDYLIDKNIALVTNKPEEQTLIILDKLNIKNYFKIIIGPESVKKLKPNPEGIEKVLNYFNADKEKTIIVGDSASDIAAGKSAGILTCGVTYGIGNKKELMKEAPHYCIEDLRQLIDII